MLGLLYSPQGIFSHVLSFSELLRKKTRKSWNFRSNGTAGNTLKEFPCRLGNCFAQKRKYRYPKKKAFWKLVVRWKDFAAVWALQIYYVLNVNCLSGVSVIECLVSKFEEIMESINSLMVRTILLHEKLNLCKYFIVNLAIHNV